MRQLLDLMTEAVDSMLVNHPFFVVVFVILDLKQKNQGILYTTAFSFIIAGAICTITCFLGS